ncbi:MAG: hypothetical protein IJW29_05270 [Clostridia bacterium]|nr:hypothetical protein [Clostridia bacterium]
MEVEKKKAEITTAILWKVLVKRFCILLIVGIVSFALMFAVSHLVFVPKYESTAKLFILRGNTIGSDQIIDDNNYVVAGLVAKQCEELLHERVVMEEVLAELKAEGLDLNMTWRELEKSMTTELAEESWNLSVTVKADSPEKAARIADKICEVGEAKIAEILREDHAHFYQPGEVIKTPCNQPQPLLMALISLGIMIILYMIFVYMFVRNDYIGSIAEIEQRLGVSVLGDIPDAEKIGKKYGTYHKSYGADAKEETK